MQRLFQQSCEVIDRKQIIDFTWHKNKLQGFVGDSLASALLANNIQLTGRGFKYGRRRGIFAAGVEEPNAITQVGTGGYIIPNAKATEVELYSNLVARSATGIPTINHDLRQWLRPLHKFMAAGFYYKTFKWPSILWPYYEKTLRQLTGLSPAPQQLDPEHYDHLYHYPDLVIVGGGFAGMAAALAAAKAGVNLFVIDERPHLGGEGVAQMARDPKAANWYKLTLKSLQAHPRITILNRTSAFHLADGNMLFANENREDFLPIEQRKVNTSRQRVHRIRFKHIILATGAHERPLLFGGNDLPGVMLCSAVARYLHEFAVLTGKNIVIAGNNDSIYPLALDLLGLENKGVVSVNLLDQRAEVPTSLQQQVTKHGGKVMLQSVPVIASGKGRVETVQIMQLNNDDSGSDKRYDLPCDLLAVSGGFNPVVHLDCHTAAKPIFDNDIQSFVPELSDQARTGAGSLMGYNSWVSCTLSGEFVASIAATRIGKGKKQLVQPIRDSINTANFFIPEEHQDKIFVDLQNDVTQKDIGVAISENFTSIEHIKRYTAMGFGTDQGKTGNVLGIAIAAKIRGVGMDKIGTTTFRPVYTPVAFGAIAGSDVGELFDPVRYTAMHQLHLDGGAVMELVGQWHRPRYFPLEGESMDAAVERECIAARQQVAMMDASTLGKIDIQGPDARELLNRIYTNSWNKLQPGRARYGIMCNEQGMIIDDGVTTCIDNNHFVMTTTTGGAAHIFQWIETWLQTEWPNLRVDITSVTDHWATTAVVGPKARKVMQSICKNINFDADMFRFMEWRSGTIGKVPVRIMRISFSGELAYEINVQANYGRFIWQKVMDAGEPWNITPYGTETMHVLRAEKGYIIVGQDTDGSVTPQDAGMSWAVSTKKPYPFIGQRSLKRSDCVRSGRKQFVGLIPYNQARLLPEGSQLVNQEEDTAMIGHITSSYLSPTLGQSIALALVADGHNRMGETIFVKPLENDGKRIGASCAATITSPVFYDKEGKHIDGEL